MPIMAVFDVPGMTAKQYDQAMRRLDAAGETHPKGRKYHAATPKDDGWFVVDVWESPDSLNRFAGVLMPILVDIGVTPPVPKVMPIHRTLQP
jgi:hypothetical protein